VLYAALFAVGRGPLIEFGVVFGVSELLTRDEFMEVLCQGVNEIGNLREEGNGQKRGESFAPRGFCPLLPLP